MFKLIRRLILLVVVLIIVAIVIVVMNLDRIIKTTVQTQASSSLKLGTTLNSASLSLLGGKLNLNQLDIASPPGYSAPHMLEVGDTTVAVSYGQLRSEPIHVSSITIAKPVLVIEQKNGELNFKKAMDDLQSGSAPSPAPSTPSNAQPIKLVIDQLNLTDPQVVIKGIMPAGDLPLSLPSLTIKNIGNDNNAANGAAVKDVVMQVISAMAASATNNAALGEFKNILGANVNAVVGQLGGEAQKRLAAALPGDVGQHLSQLVADPNALMKNPKAALNNVLGGDSSGATTQPGADVKGQATDALKGLLGGKK
jgi:hypothetical protein